MIFLKNSVLYYLASIPKNSLFTQALATDNAKSIQVMG